MKKSKLLTHDKGYLDCYFLNMEPYKKPLETKDCNEGENCFYSPKGPEGESGTIGVDLTKEELQTIINDILADAGDIQVNLTSEAGRNFVSKRIIEVFWPK